MKHQESKSQIVKSTQTRRKPGGAVAEQPLIDEAFRRADRAFRMLSRCNQLLVRAEDEMVFLKDLCRIMVKEGGYRMAWVGYAEEDGQKKVRPVTQAGFEKGYLQSIKITWSNTKLGRGPTGTAIRTGKPAIQQDILTDRSYAPWRDEAVKRGYGSSIALPLANEERVFGALNIYAPEPDAFDDEEATLLSELAADLAYGIMALRRSAERKQVEEELRASEADFHSIFEQSPVGIFQSTPQGRFMRVNPAMARIFGYDSAEEMAGAVKNIRTQIYVEPTDRKDFVAALQSQGVIKNFEARNYRKDGSIIWTSTNARAVCSAEGQVEYYEGFITDITERKCLETALLRREREFQTLVENSPDAVTRFDLQRRYQYINPARAGYFGRPASEIIGRNWWELLKPQEREEGIIADKTFEKVLADPREYTIEYQTLTPSGSRWVQSRAVPEFALDGSLESILSITRDITPLKQTLEALARERRDYQAIIDAAPIMIAYKSKDDHFVRVNNAFAEFVGMPAEKIIGMTTFDLVKQPEVAQRGREHDLEVIRTGKPVVNQLVKWSGFQSEKEIWALYSKYPFYDFDGSILGTVSFVVDVNDRVRAEEALRASEERLRNVLENSPDTIYVIDFAVGKVTILNKDEFCGYSKQELERPGSIMGAVHPDDLGVVKEDWGKIMNGDFASPIEYRLQRKDGNWVFIEQRTSVLARDPQGAPGQLLVTLSDITERKRAEKALRRAEERYRTLVETADDVILLTDLSGKHLYRNSAFYTSLGLDVGADVDIDGYVRVHPDDMAIMKEATTKLLETGTATSEYRVRHRDGHWVYRQAKSVTLYDAERKPEAFLAIIRDISERKRAEEALRLSEERFSKAFRDAPAGMTITRIADGKFVDANDSFCRMFEFSREEVIGHFSTELNLWTPEERRKIIEEQIKPGGLQNYELQGRSKSGRIVTILFSSKPLELEGETHHITTMIDVTGRKQAEEALRALSSRQQAILAAVPDIIMEVNNDKVYTWANQAGIEFFGGDAIGKEAAFYFEGEQETYNVVQPLFNGVENVIYVESWQRRKDGQKRLLAWWCRVLKDENGNVAGALSTARDITEVKRAEEALMKSEALYHDLVETSQDLIWQCDAEGRYTYLNPAWEKTFGYKVEEMLGKHFSDFQPPEYAERDLREFESLMQGNIVKGFETVHLGKDGREIHLVFNAKFLRDENGNITGTRGMAYDITERKLAEKALASSEARYRSLVESASAGIASFNTSGEFTYANQRLCEMTGYSQEELIGKPFADFLHPDDLGTIMDIFQNAALNPNASPKLEFRIIHKEGQIVYGFSVPTVVWDGGKIAGFNAIVQDITERKRAEHMLRASEERFRKFVETSPDGITILGLDGLISYISPRILEIYGYGGEAEIIGRSPMEWIAPEDRERAKTNIGNVFKGINTTHNRYRLLKKDGAIFWGEINSSVLKDVKGNPTGMIAITRDVTEQVQAGDEIERRAEQLAALNALGRRVSQSLSLAQVCEDAIQEVAKAIQPGLTFLFLREGERLLLKSVLPRRGKSMFKDVPEHRVGECMCGLAVREGIPLYSRDILSDTRCTWEECKRTGLRSFAALPLRSGHEVIGVIGLASKIERDFETQAGFLETLANQAATGLQNARLYESIQQQSEQLRALNQHLQTAREEERTAIAREIHDELGQALTAMKMDLAQLAKQLPPEGTGLIQKASDLAALVDSTIQIVRRVASSLRPGLLDDLGLVAALEWQAGEFQARRGIACKLDLPEVVTGLSRDQETALFRICQEALTNISRHAQATKVRIALKELPEGMEFVIHDNGIGITESQMNDARSFGLVGMRERVQAFGGSLEVRGTDGKGTMVRVKVPLGKTFKHEGHEVHKGREKGRSNK
jgi:PAS domain S-box-containing protein